jgi:hypothetical protein
MAVAALVLCIGLTVDAYAVQHPPNRDRRNRQSVALHLMSLCLVLERDEHMGRATGAIAEHAKRHRGREFPWLEPPASLGEMTVLSVHAADDPEDHVRRVRAWAASVWNACSGYHPRVRGWLDAREID